MIIALASRNVTVHECKVWGIDSKKDVSKGLTHRHVQRKHFAMPVMEPGDEHKKTISFRPMATDIKTRRVTKIYYSQLVL